VRSVEKGSPAERAGFRAGDVITRIGNEAVTDTSDWRHAMHSHAAGPVQVKIIRDRRPLTLSFSLPKQTGKASVAAQPYLSARVDLSGVQEELRSLRPQMEQAQRQMQRQISQAMREEQREMEQQQREWQKSLHEQMKRLPRQIHEM
jgi:membrane-associated protease RseP (regulator of RpoE activity)